MDASKHPYFPPSASIPSYVPNEYSTFRLVASMITIMSTVVVFAYWLAARSPLKLRPLDKFAVSWFALCGFLHVVYEGYYVYHWSELAGMQTIFGQLWKEYAKSDSRYLTSNVFLVCIEAMTVIFWGPLSWLTFFNILTDSPYRHINQVIMCTSHLSSVTLYYATSWTDEAFAGLSHCRPEFLYYWVYFVSCNAPWVIVPLVLLYDSYRQVAKAFRSTQGIRERKKQ